LVGLLHIILIFTKIVIVEEYNFAERLIVFCFKAHCNLRCKYLHYSHSPRQRCFRVLNAGEGQVAKAVSAKIILAVPGIFPKNLVQSEHSPLQACGLKIFLISINSPAIPDGTTFKKKQKEEGAV